MAKFTVNLKEIWLGSFEVEADSEAEAEDKFWDLVATGEIDTLDGMDLIDSQTFIG